MKGNGARQGLMDIFERFFAAYGPRDWWPAKTKTEVVVGAILTQNTAWKNVERAIKSLREAGCLNWKALRDVSEEELAGLIRSSGTFRVKAKRLKAFVDVLWKEHDGSLRAMLNGEVEDTRKRLLKISGVGPETADAILLYAGDRPTFVVDAYTKRILRRHFFIDERAGYDEVRDLFQSQLPPDAKLFNEYHALLVEVGKRHCRTKAECDGCPLVESPHDSGL